MNILIIGAGRAGASFAAALAPTHHVTLVHHDHVDADGADLVMLCVPDDAIADVARRLRVGPDTVVAHVAGSRGLDVLAPHRRVGSLHPLATLPDVARGAPRLRGGVFCVEGDPLVADVVASLGARTLRVSASDRVLYHAAAASAANHLVALLAHVEALAHGAHLALADFLPLAQQAVDDVASDGVARALTGPAARGDQATIAAHLAAIPPEERTLYEVLSERAARVAREARASSVAS